MAKLSGKQQVICLMGLTGAGKTDLAMKLYDVLDIELISVDSAMIYRGMDIGTAKPDAKELSQYPHHLVDIIEPDKQYSAAQFCQDVEALIADIFARGKQPLLVGGTMLYFKAWQQGLNQLPASDPATRLKWQQRLQQQGLAALYQQLCQIDKPTANRLSANDPQRILRALEIFDMTGKPLSAHHAADSKGTDYDYINIGLVANDRRLLHQRLEQRFELMIEQGFEQEVRDLLAQGYAADLPAFRSVGYKQMLAYIFNELNFDEMRQQAVAATRQLAKRQHTWLRKWPELHSFDPWDMDFCQILGILGQK